MLILTGHVLEELRKALIWIKEHQRKNGTRVKAHQRNVQTKAERKEVIDRMAHRMADGSHVAHANHASAISAARAISRRTGGVVHAYQNEAGVWHTGHTLPDEHVAQQGRVVAHGGRTFTLRGSSHEEFKTVRGPIAEHDPAAVKPVVEKIKRPKQRKPKAPQAEPDDEAETQRLLEDAKTLLKYRDSWGVKFDRSSATVTRPVSGRKEGEQYTLKRGDEVSWDSGDGKNKKIETGVVFGFDKRKKRVRVRYTWTDSNGKAHVFEDDMTPMSLSPTDPSAVKPFVLNGDTQGAAAASDDASTSGNKPGGQPGNQNAYKGGTKEEEQAITQPQEAGESATDDEAPDATPKAGFMEKELENAGSNYKIGMAAHPGNVYAGDVVHYPDPQNGGKPRPVVLLSVSPNGDLIFGSRQDGASRMPTKFTQTEFERMNATHRGINMLDQVLDNLWVKTREAKAARHRAWAEEMFKQLDSYGLSKEAVNQLMLMRQLVPTVADSRMKAAKAKREGYYSQSTVNKDWVVRENEGNMLKAKAIIEQLDKVKNGDAMAPGQMLRGLNRAETCAVVAAQMRMIVDSTFTLKIGSGLADHLEKTRDLSEGDLRQFYEAVDDIQQVQVRSDGAMLIRRNSTSKVFTYYPDGVSAGDDHMLEGIPTPDDRKFKDVTEQFKAPFLNGTGRKPGAQLGNQNAYKGGPKDEDRPTVVDGMGDTPPIEARTFEGMTRDEVHDHIKELANVLANNTFYEGFKMIKDSTGFNAADDNVVRGILGSSTPMDADDHAFVASVLLKYKNQIINRHGIGAYQIVSDYLESLYGPESERRAAALDGLRKRPWVVNGKPSSVKPKIQIHATDGGAHAAQFAFEGKYAVRFAYDRNIVEAMKNLPREQRVWDNLNKQWIVSAAGAKAILSKFGDQAGIETAAYLGMEDAATAESEAEQQKQAEQTQAISEARTLLNGEMPEANEYVNRALQVLKAPPAVLIENVAQVDMDKMVAIKLTNFSREVLNKLKATAPVQWDNTGKRWLCNPRVLGAIISAFPEIGMNQAVYEKYGHMLTMADEDLNSRSERIKFKEHDKENTAFEEPKGWATHKMHDYQRKGANWLLATKKGILGFGVGLGKTNISIAAAAKVLEQGKRPVICTVPGKRLYGWKNDIETAVPGTRVLVLDQGKKEREKLIASGALNDYDFIIVTYRMQTLEKDALMAAKPAVLINDEAHKLKGKQTQQTKAASELSDATEYVWDLTATPMPNNPDELANLIRRNHPTAMKSSRMFERFYEWEWVKTPRGDVKKITGIKDPEGMAKEVAPFLYMKRGDSPDVNLELPAMREGRTVLTDWEPNQKKAYDQAAADVLKYIESLGQNPSAAEKAKVLVMISKCEQIAISPELVDPNYEPATGYNRTPKIQELCDEIENRRGEYPNQGHVIFCRFAKALRIAQRELLADSLFAPHEIAIIDGETKKSDVAQIEADLNSGKLKCVICSDAAMEGLNFQRGSNHLVNLDTPWSPYMSEQRHGRVYRQGQKNPVRITTLALGGIDERKAAAVEAKAKMNRDLFGGGDDGEKAMASLLSMDDLKAMLRR